MTTANRIVVNFDRIPPAERGCYEFALVGDAGLVGDLTAIREARSERLTMFSAEPRPTVRSVFQYTLLVTVSASRRWQTRSQCLLKR